MQRQDFLEKILLPNLQILPAELWVQIFSMMPYEYIEKNFLSVSKSLREMLTDHPHIGQKIWEKKFSFHFPHKLNHVYDEINKKSFASWYEEFNKCDKNERLHLSLDLMKLFPARDEAERHHLTLILRNLLHAIKRENVERKDVESFPALISAISYTNTIDLQKLLHDVKVGWTSLMRCAILIGNQNILDLIYQTVSKKYQYKNEEYFIEVAANCYQPMSENTGSSILPLSYWAIYCFQATSLIQELLAREQPVCYVGGHGSLLSIAVEKQFCEGVRLLLEIDSIIDYANRFSYLNQFESGDNLLITAIQRGNAEIVRMLLTSGIQYDKSKIIIEAICKKRIDIFNMVLEISNYDYSCPLDNFKFLDKSVSYGFHEGVKTFLSDQGKLSDFPRVLLESAIEGWHLDNLKALLAKCGKETADLYAYGLAFKLSVKNKFLEAAQEILKKCNPVAWVTLSPNALDLAINNWDLETVKYLLQNSDNVEVTKFQSALIFATKIGFYQVIPLLLAKGAKTLAMDSTGRNALYYAVENDRIHVLQILLTYPQDKTGATISLSSYVGKEGYSYKTILQFAAERGNLSAVKMLYGMFCPINIPQNLGRKTPLHLAMENKHFEVAEFLIKQGAIIDPENTKRESLIYLTWRNGWMGKLKATFNELEIYQQDQRGLTDLALRDIIERNNIDGLKEFLLLSPKLTEAILCFAIQHRKYSSEVLKCLLLHDSSLLRNDAVLKNLIHLCIELDDVNAIRCMSEFSINVSSFMWQDIKKLMKIAMQSNKEKILYYLISLYKSYNSMNASDGIFEAIDIAIKNNMPDMVSFLLKKSEYERVVIPCGFLLSAIESCIASNHMDALSTILDHHPYLSSPEVMNLIAIKGNANVVKIFLSKKGIDTDGILNLLMNNQVDIVAVIAELSIFCVNNNLSKKMETLLHLATEKNQILAVKAILAKGTEINAANQEWETPLHVAVKMGCVDLTSFLMRKGAYLSSIDKNCKTPLSLAAEMVKQNPGNEKYLKIQRLLILPRLKQYITSLENRLFNGEEYKPFLGWQLNLGIFGVCCATRKFEAAQKLYALYSAKNYSPSEYKKIKAEYSKEIKDGNLNKINLSFRRK